MKKGEFEKMKQLDRIELLLRRDYLGKTYNANSAGFVLYGFVLILGFMILGVVFHQSTGSLALLKLNKGLLRTFGAVAIVLFLLDVLKLFIYKSKIKRAEERLKR